MMKTATKSQFLGELIRNKVLFLMMVPGLLILLVNNYIPMLGSIIAFKNINYGKGILRSEWAGFKNFEFFLKTPDAFIITRNTILYNLTFIILGLVVSISLAIALNELINRKLAKLYQTMMFLPYFLSWVVVAYVGYALMDIDYGFINKTILEFFNKEAINWYLEAKYWIFIIPIANIWKYAGYSCVLYLAAITGLDTEYYEAAVLDGATKWQQIIRITIPLLKPMIIVLTIMAVGRIFNADFGLFFQLPMDSGPLYPTTNVIDTYVYRSLLKMNDFGMSAAAGLYQSVVGFVLVFCANLVVRKVSKEDAIF